MTLSRTARFLIAALLVAAAAFVWVNYFNQDPLSTQADVTAPVGLAGAPATTVAGDAPVTVPGADTSPGATTAAGAGTPADGSAATAASGDTVDTTDAATAGAATSESAQSALPGEAPATTSTTAPAVIVTDAPTVATRDLVVDVLPFLVTTPPVSGLAAADAEAAGASRPQVTQRSSINPFSPVVVQAAPAAPSANVVAQSTPPPAESPVIEVVNGPATPPTTTASGSSAAGANVATAPTPVAAPAPRAVAPASTVASNLPRALPSGMLPTTPDILRDTRSQPVIVTPVIPDLAAIAALRVPEGEQQDVELEAVAASILSDEAVTPDIIGVQSRESAVASGSALPLAVGADPLSRYLRDNDVRFTGTVLGPLSVGVFRSNLYGSPVVLTLGQPLPETDIILSDLRGYEARFSLGETTQTLSLDLRR
ncbi:MAG TPA: hypothetical protein VFD39_09280 [Trueperaceae bacterium]|nr:hypothetical protein [Trueperaceae bacterium]